MNIKRTTSENLDFMKLVKKLDAYLKITDQDEHDFYNQFNNIDVLSGVVIVYDKNKAVGCGAIKKFNATTLEIKRMYVSPKKRGVGIAQKILAELEVWAKEMGANNCILETGTRQQEAVSFYKKCGYSIIPNYAQYKEMENSICFEKKI